MSEQAEFSNRQPSIQQGRGVVHGSPTVALDSNDCETPDTTSRETHGPSQRKRSKLLRGAATPIENPESRTEEDHVRIVLQRVTAASVEVDQTIVGSINHGLLALVAVGHDDTEDEALWLANKTVELRIFQDEQDKMNRSVIDVEGSVLVVSQFTLLGDCRKGRRPAFTDAAPPELARQLYHRYAELISDRGVNVQMGIFAADMKVSLVNNGPVTMVIDRDHKLTR